MRLSSSHRALLRAAAVCTTLALTAGSALAQSYEVLKYELSTPGAEPSEELRALLPAEIRDRGTLLVGGRWDAPPYAFFPEGTKDWTGFEADLVRGIATVLGLDIVLEPITNEQTVLGVNANRYDIGVGFFANLEARQETVTNITYLRNIFGIIVPAENPHGVEEVSDACGLKTIQTGGNFDYAGALNAICEEKGLPLAERVQVAEGVNGLLALKSGQIDVYFQSYGQQKYFEEVVDEPIHAIVAPEIGWVGMGLIAKNDRTDVQDAVLGAVKHLHEIGYYDELIEKWEFQPLYEANPQINGGQDSRWWATPKAAQ